MKKSDLIPAVDVEARANPMIWDGEEAAQGVFVGSPPDEDPLALLGVPTLELPPAPRLPEDFEPSEDLRNWLAELQSALSRTARGESGQKLLDMAALAPIDRQAIEEILGEGEVQGHVALDGVRYSVQESLLPGIWRINGDDGSARVEVGAAPSVITAAAASLAPADFTVHAPAGQVINAPAVLAEISEKARAWTGTDDAPNHVLNFTLLPMSEADHDLLTAVLGRADLELNSGGFGDCRIMATRYRHVWAVQFVNAMGHTILDTIEVGRLPTAACAAPEDFEDSEQRLADLLETYLS